MSSNKRLALLASGGGTTVEAILRACREGRLPYIEPAVLITDRPGAGVVERTKWSGIPHHLVERKCFGRTEFGRALIHILDSFAVDIVGQFGWLSHTPVNTINQFTGMAMINQHSAPVPWFGGKGMWGKRPHAAVLKFCKLVHRENGRVICDTDMVCHQVDQIFDHGEVLWYKSVPIMPNDTPSTLQARALPIEWNTQIEALERLSQGTFGKSNSYYAHPFVRQGEEDLAREAVAYALTTEP